MADGDDEDAFGDLEALLGGGDDGSEAASSGSEAEVEPEADDDDDLFGELASAFDTAPDEPEPEPDPLLQLTSTQPVQEETRVIPWQQVEVKAQVGLGAFKDVHHGKWNGRDVVSRTIILMFTGSVFYKILSDDCVDRRSSS